VYHHLSATGGGKTASFYDGRNLIYILMKDVPAIIWRKHGGAIIVEQLKIATEAIRAWRGEAARARLRGMLAGILALPKLLKKRRQIQASKTITDTEIEMLLAAPQS
jgi:hypothetical protein